MMSRASEMSPSPLGSIAQSIASRMPTPEHEVETEEQTFSAYRSTPGAMPLWEPSALRPPRMSDTWVPWPSKSIGFGSGSRSVLGQFSPTKSAPPLTLGAVGPNSVAQSPVGAAVLPASQVSYAAVVPGPPRFL